jgi:hypothetical protein
MKPEHRHHKSPFFERIIHTIGEFLLRNVFMRGKIKPVVLNFEPKTKPVDVLLPDKSVVPGKFLIWVNDPKNPNVLRVTVQFLDKEFSNTDTSFNHALHKVHRELDAQGILLKCYGCSRNVWGSSMSSNMMGGGTAFTHYLGDRKHERVVIFDSGPDVDPCTFEEQKQFHKKWMLSIGIDPEKKVIPWKSLFMQQPVKTLRLYFKEKSRKT